MDYFVARENIRGLRTRLRSETDRLSGAVLQRLLVDEDNKLAADFELLADVAREITRCQELIENQRALVSTLDGDGRDVTRARALLDGLTEALIVHQDYHQRVATRLEQNPSYREIRGRAWPKSKLRPHGPPSRFSGQRGPSPRPPACQRGCCGWPAAVRRPSTTVERVSSCGRMRP